GCGRGGRCRRAPCSCRSSWARSACCPPSRSAADSRETRAACARRSSAGAMASFLVPAQPALGAPGASRRDARWARGGAAPRGARRAIACAGFAVLAAGVQTVHAFSWRGALVTWGVVVGALGLDLAVSTARFLAPGRRAAAAGALRRTTVTLVVFCVAGLGLAAIRGEATALLRVPLDALMTLLGPGHAPAPSGEHWPDTLATVSELSHSGLAGIANGVGGALFCFVGWLGLLLLVLPRRGWGPAHFAVLIGGTLLYRGLLAAPEMSRAVLLGL